MQNIILEEWIQDLQIQNKDLIDTIEDLEKESIDRMSILEERIRQISSSQSVYAGVNKEGQSRKSLKSTALAQSEINVNTVQKLKDDIKGLLEVIRRAREDKTWNVCGIKFNTVSYEDILGNR